MPVTFRPAQHLANSIINAEPVSAIVLLGACNPIPVPYPCDEILESFLGHGSWVKGRAVQAAHDCRLGYMRHGFVHTIAEAYLSHRALILRPDDVWLAILTQFGVYINKHADELREKFVYNEGMKKAVIFDLGIRYSVDFGDISHRMTSEMEKFVVDPMLRNWILPKFSTTTKNDMLVASVAMLGTMSHSFGGEYHMACGIPQVVLEGKRSDWNDILRRVQKFVEFGDETTAWYALMRPVLSRFVRAFDDPDSKENLDFWNNVVVSHSCVGHAEPEFKLTGWLSAFCVFDEEGSWIGNPVTQVLHEWHNSSLELNELKRQEAQSSVSANVAVVDSSSQSAVESDKRGCLILDGMAYHHLYGNSIPSAILDVDVTVIADGVQFHAMLVAGIVGATVLDSGNIRVSATGLQDTISPTVGWWLFVKRGGDQSRLTTLLAKMSRWRDEQEMNKHGSASKRRSSLRKWVDKLLLFR